MGPPSFPYACAVRCHAVQFYDDVECLARLVTDFVVAGLRDRGAAIIVATRANRPAFEGALRRHAAIVEVAQGEGRLLLLDAESLLDRLTEAGRFDRDRFMAEVAPSIERLVARSPIPPRVYGEMVDLLRRTGRTADAVALETCWNELLTRHDFVLFCGYDVSGTPVASPWIDEVRRAHTHVVPTVPGAMATSEWETAVVEAITESDALASPVRAQLVCVVGDQLGESFPVPAAPTIIGRASDAGIHVSGPGVSRHHARIHGHDGGFWLEDLGGLNGTLVNGVKIDRRVLCPGDRLQLGRVALVFLSHDDATASAMRLQRLEAASQLAGGLAHDLRNVLMVVMASIDAIGEWASDQAPPDDVKEAIADVHLAAKDGASLAQRLLDFTAREPAAVATRTRVAAAIGELRSIIRRSVGRRIDVDLRAETTAEVAIDRSALHQVLINLCNNARDAMPDGGTLTIRARTTPIDEPLAEETGLGVGDLYAEITIADTGCGMDDAVLARLFEPFFTTKPSGKGTGLGLTVSRTIIRDSGGRLDVSSRRGVGTTFRILLPALGE